MTRNHIPQSLVQHIEDRALAFHLHAMADAAEMGNWSCETLVKQMREAAARFEARSESRPPVTGREKASLGEIK